MVASTVPLRRFILLALAAAALMLTACRSGVTAGEGPGVKGYSEGELNGNVPGDLEAAKAAVEQTLVQMGVLNADEKRDAVLVEINARTLQEVPLEIKISRISDDLTKLRIRAGNDNRELARSIFDRVNDRLRVQFQ